MSRSSDGASSGLSAGASVGTSERASEGVSSGAPGELTAAVPSRSVIAQELAAAGHGDISLHLYAELPSTSRWLEARAARGEASDVSHAATACVCAADLQTAGHGRRGKAWVSVPGNVAVSILTHVPLSLSDLGGLSLVTGIAVSQALERTLPLKIGLKWPNDVLVGAAKLGGLLMGVEACVADSKGVPCSRVVTGIGLNVVHDPRVAELGIGGTSLAAVCDAPASNGEVEVDRDRLLGEIVASVLDAQALFVAEGWAPFAREWCARDVLAGREVSVDLGHEVCQGRALGVAADGALRVEFQSCERTFHGGEVSVRATPERPLGQQPTEPFA